jgi:hypothetical protein
VIEPGRDDGQRAGRRVEAIHAVRQPSGVAEAAGRRTPDAQRASDAGRFFTPAIGYRPGIGIDGIELRDRVWLDRPVRPAS